MEVLIIIEKAYDVSLLETSLMSEDLEDIASLARCIDRARRPN